MNPSRSLVIQIAALLALALAVRAVYFLQMHDSQVFQVLICDAWTYDLWAKNIAAGDWIGKEVFYQTPLYPYSIACLYTVFGPNVWAVRIAQAILSSLACVFLARAATRFFNPRAGWIAGILLAIYPPAIFFDGILQKASLDLFLISALLWSIARCQPDVNSTPIDVRPRALSFALVGAFLGLLILNRENAAIFVPVIFLWTSWISSRSRWRFAWRPLLALTLAIAAVLVPVGLRNQYVGGEFLLTTSQLGPNFYIGNHAHADGRYTPLRPSRGDPRYERFDAKTLAEQTLNRSLSPSEVSDFWVQTALRDIENNPARWLRLLAWKAFLTFHTVEIVDAEGIAGHARESTLLAWMTWLPSFGLICPLAVIGLWRTRKQWRQLWILYALIASFALAVTIFYVFARYRYPLVPMLTLFAAAGLGGFWGIMRGARQLRKDGLVGLALALPVAAFCNWPLPGFEENDIETTLLNVGTGFMDLNRPAEALPPLEEIKVFRPRSTSLLVLLGRVHKELSEPQKAQAYFEQAIALEPDHTIALLNLGLILQKQGDIARASHHLARCLELDPVNTEALRALGTIEVQSGAADSGLERLRKAAKLDPESSRTHADLGAALLSQRLWGEALVELRTAIEKNALALDAANNLAWTLATCPNPEFRNPAEAIKVAEDACKKLDETDPQFPQFLDTLAAAQAAAGRFDEAVTSIQRAIQKTPFDHPLRKTLENRLSKYTQQQPWIDPD